MNATALSQSIISSTASKRLRRAMILLVATASFVAPASAQLYEPGDIVENFTLVDRATNQPVQLTDYAGKVIFLEWFAWWCPFCQAAAQRTGPEIGEYYESFPNANGVPVAHVAVNLQGGEETQTQEFIDFYGLGQVLNDFDRMVADRFAFGGQPIFAVINGVENSGSHEQWELVYSHLGYGDMETPIQTFRQAINSVQAATAPPTEVPRITQHPLSQTVAPGSDATLAVQADDDGAVIQWTRNGAPIAGATSPVLELINVQTSDAGYYVAEVTNTAGVVQSRYARLVVGPSEPSRIVNLSVRAPAGVGGSPLIVGFAVSGGSRSLLVRGIGPSLADLGVPNALADSRLTVYSGSDPIAMNDDWGTGDVAEVADASASVFAFPLETDSRDAALLATVSGTRTVHISGQDGEVGVALAEVYDTGDTESPRLINVSARNFVGTGGDILITGFVINGNEPLRVLIRGVGPGLAQFGVPDVLADPILEIHTTIDDADTVVAVNDDWGDESDPTAWHTVVPYAFALEPGSKDSVLLLTLPAGIYTAHVRGVDDTTGNGLVEVYEAP